MFGLEIWDVVLLVAVATMGATIAYIHNPRWKAFVLMLPIPFTLATLAVNRPIDATNVAAMVVMLLYTHAVRVMHCAWNAPIVPSIALSAAGYCVVGAMLARVIPPTDAAFWVACLLVAVIAGALYFGTNGRNEPGHRSTMPLWLKLPIIAVVVLGLIVVKKSLGGFVTMFPMVGVVAAYESRHSLWTTCRQIPVLMLTMIPFMIVCRSTQHRLGIGVALGLGWLVYAAIVWPVTLRMWRGEKSD